MRRKIFIMMLMMVIGCTACGSAEKDDTEVKQEVESVDGKDISDKEDVEINVEDEVEEKTSIIVYYPDEMYEEVLRESVEHEDITEDMVWNLLIEKGVVQETCKINKMEQEKTSLVLDVNEAFGEQLRSYGTAGENMFIQCVVNTFLDTYQCERIKITENGGILCSGHAEYEDYFTKYE